MDKNISWRPNEYEMYSLILFLKEMPCEMPYEGST